MSLGSGEWFIGIPIGQGKRTSLQNEDFLQSEKRRCGNRSNVKEDAKLDMTFESFYEIYVEDMKNRIRDNTWGTKTNIARTKILPYFGKRKIGEIEPRDIIAWQNELLAIYDSQMERVFCLLSAENSQSVKCYFQSCS